MSRVAGERRGFIVPSGKSAKYSMDMEFRWLVVSSLERQLLMEHQTSQLKQSWSKVVYSRLLKEKNYKPTVLKGVA
jgi:hypothetical protein